MRVADLAILINESLCDRIYADIDEHEFILVFKTKYGMYQTFIGTKTTIDTLKSELKSFLETPARPVYNFSESYSNPY